MALRSSLLAWRGQGTLAPAGLFGNGLTVATRRHGCARLDGRSQLGASARGDVTAIPAVGLLAAGLKKSAGHRTHHRCHLTATDWWPSAWC